MGNVSFVATKSYASNLTCSWVIHPKCPQPCAIVATITNIDLETGSRKCSSFGFDFVCKQPRLFFLNRLRLHHDLGWMQLLKMQLLTCREFAWELQRGGAQGGFGCPERCDAG